MRRITGRFLDWIIVVSGGLILLGAVLVSRAANEGRLENDLISPWHVPLYVGVFLAAYALLASADRSRGALWRSELPDGYAFRVPKTSLLPTAEWVSLERKCCPFFAFTITQAEDQGAGRPALPREARHRRTNQSGHFHGSGAEADALSIREKGL